MAIIFTLKVKKGMQVQKIMVECNAAQLVALLVEDSVELQPVEHSINAAKKTYDSNWGKPCELCMPSGGPCLLQATWMKGNQVL